MVAKVRLSERRGGSEEEEEEEEEKEEEERRDTSSTLGQAQSIEVCFGRTKLTLCQPALRSSLPRTTVTIGTTATIATTPPSTSLLYPRKQRCLLFEWGESEERGEEGWRTGDGGRGLNVTECHPRGPLPLKVRRAESSLCLSVSL